MTPFPFQWRSDFIYDGLNRRRIERDYTWQSGSGSWTKTNETHFIYDGYLLTQERDASNNVLVTYTRGLDMASSLRDAGGIGGLLARTDANGSTFYHADGAGNVTALIDGSENIVARYLYGPYGKLVGQWGSMAAVNTMQFSSMPHHSYSGLLLYPYRAYDPNLQRWLTRDPLEEGGGINMYGFGGNDPINQVDSDGRFVLSVSFLAFDAFTLAKDALNGRPLGTDGAFLALDLAAVAADTATAGTGGEGMELASAGARAGRMAARALEADQAALKAGEVSAADAAAAAAHLAKLSGQVMAMGNALNGGGKPPCPYKGGKHGDIKNPSGDGMDSHHMPAKQASPLDPDEGTAIQMDPADHRETASYGGGPDSPQQDYRDAQKALIDQGKFEDAFLMDVDDVTSKFPGKYDDAILQAIDALPKKK